MKKVNLIGYGYWGSKMAQVATKSGLFEIVHICDPNSEALDRASKDFPNASLDRSSLMSSKGDVAFVMSPANLHDEHVTSARICNNHALVTKPYSGFVGKDRDINGKPTTIVSVDYTFIYSSALDVLKKNLDLIGFPLYYHSDRLSSGIYRNDCNILEDLAPHDLSILFSLFPSTEIVKSSVKSIFSSNVFKNDYATLSFSLNSNLHVVANYAWSFFKKCRGVSIVGDKGTLHFDDAKFGQPDCVTFTPHKFNGYQINPQTFFEKSGSEVLLGKPGISALEQEMISFNDYIDNGMPPDVVSLMKKITKYTEMLKNESAIFTPQSNQ